MEKRKTKKLCLFMAVIFLLSSCATPRLTPHVVAPARQCENYAASTEGVEIGVTFWNKERAIEKVKSGTRVFPFPSCGVIPTRLIIENNSNLIVKIDTSQITVTDVNGTVYKPFTAEETANTIVASQAFESFVTGAISGAIAGAIIGGLIGGAVGGRRIARYGATVGGIEGAAGGAVGSRIEMERTVRADIQRVSMKDKTLGIKMRDEGIIFLPTVNIVAINIYIENFDERKQPIILTIPISNFPDYSTLDLEKEYNKSRYDRLEQQK